MKYIVYLIMLALTITTAAALSLNAGTMYNPSLSNVTYIMNTTNSTFTEAEVNETCFRIDSTSWCNQSSTPIFIQLFQHPIAWTPTPPVAITATGGMEWIKLNWTEITEPEFTTYYTGNVEVGGCIKYNCSQPSGCVIFGECI